MKTVDRVEEYTKQGFATKEIAEMLNISAASVSYHKNKLGLAGTSKLKYQNHKVDWEEAQRLIDSGLTHIEVCEKINCAKQTLTAAYKRGQVSRPKLRGEMTLVEYLAEWDGVESNSSFTQIVKRRMVQEGHCTLACSICELVEWRGQPAPLELDHIDGDPTNNRLGNLRILCLHCHTQTETFGWRNKKVRAKLGRK